MSSEFVTIAEEKRNQNFVDMLKPIDLSGSSLYNNLNNIGITHVFSCINNCRVPRKLFEHQASRPSVQTLSEGPGKY